MITVGLAGIPSDKTCVISGCLLLTDAYQLQLLSASRTRHTLVSSVAHNFTFNSVTFNVNVNHEFI